MAFGHKKGILSRHFSTMTPKIVRMKYSLDIVKYAFKYNAIALSWIKTGFLITIVSNIKKDDIKSFKI